MATKTITLELDALEKLEAAKWTPEETFSDVVRRAQFPQKPHLARELLEDFRERAGRSPMSKEALDNLEEAQRALGKPKAVLSAYRDQGPPWRVEKTDDPKRYGDLQSPVLEEWK
jgi:predicted CopG family antitoxin